jgi:hypothetical protein
VDDHIPLYLESKYEGQKFGLFQSRFQSFSEEFEKLYWSEGIILILIDNDDRVVWQESRAAPALRDLFDSAKRKVSKIDAIVDMILSKK